MQAARSGASLTHWRFPLFGRGNCNDCMMRPIATVLCRAPEDCPAAIVQLVERCLQTDPAARPTAAEAVQVIAANLHG